MILLLTLEVSALPLCWRLTSACTFVADVQSSYETPYDRLACFHIHLLIPSGQFELSVYKWEPLSP